MKRGEISEKAIYCNRFNVIHDFGYYTCHGIYDARIFRCPKYFLGI